MFVCANVAYPAHVLTNGPAPRSLGAYVFSRSQTAKRDVCCHGGHFWRWRRALSTVGTEVMFGPMF